jgi:hypothetical protein
MERAGRLRYLGPHALIEDNASAATRRCWSTCARRGRRSTHGWEFYAELLNVFDSEADDIDYYYATRFPASRRTGSRTQQPHRRAAAAAGGVKKTF